MNLWPWTRTGPAKDDVRELRQELSDVRSEFKRIRAEWEDMYEKLVRRDDRTRKREERERDATHAQVPKGDRKAALWARVRSNGSP